MAGRYDRLAAVLVPAGTVTTLAAITIAARTRPTTTRMASIPLKLQPCQYLIVGVPTRFKAQAALRNSIKGSSRFGNDPRITQRDHMLGGQPQLDCVAIKSEAIETTHSLHRESRVSPEGRPLHHCWT